MDQSSRYESDPSSIGKVRHLLSLVVALWVMKGIDSCLNKSKHEIHSNSPKSNDLSQKRDIGKGFESKVYKNDS